MNRGWAAAVLGAALVGCAYYNGLYNANHLAADARKAEREGRTGEARSLWSQVAVKAESVVARFPHSKYRDDALLMQGRALRHVDACTQAVVPLVIATDSSPDPVIRRDARLLLGECRLEMREPDSAVVVLAPLVDDHDSATTSAARWWRARAELALGQDDVALADLSRSHEPLAPFDRVIALVHLGRGAEAGAVLSSVAGGPYDESIWLSSLDTLGMVDRAAASGLVDRLSSRDDLTRGQRARLLLQDGRRWNGHDADRAAARFDAVQQVAPDSLETRVAKAYSTMGMLRRTTELDSVPPLVRVLRDVVRDGGTPTLVVGRTVDWLGRFGEITQGNDADDLDLFLLAELVRDSIHAPALSARLFERLQEHYATSPLAPKALLAAAAIDTTAADSLRGVLQQTYPTSPYALVLVGRGDSAYTALEDSLRLVLRERIAAGAVPGRRNQ